MGWALWPHGDGFEVQWSPYQGPPGGAGFTAGYGFGLQGDSAIGQDEARQEVWGLGRDGSLRG